MLKVAYLLFVILQSWSYMLGMAETTFPCSNQDGFGLAQGSFNSSLNLLYETYGHPDLHRGGRQTPYLDLDIKLADYVAEYAVVVSLHNHAGIVTETIGSLLSKTWGSFEIVLVFDDCSDDSLSEVHQLIKTWLASSDFTDMQCKSSILTRIRCIVQPSSVWETSSDNLGMRVSQPTGYYLLVQADMVIHEPGYNLKLSVPTEVYNDLFAISARCSHNLVSRTLSDAAVGQPLNNASAANVKNWVFVRDTVNRGPLLLRADRMCTLGFFDEHNFFLGDDDHNLMLRAFVAQGWKSGYFHVDFVSPMEYGATRHVDKSSPSPAHLHYLQARKDQIDLSEQESMLRIISEHGDWNENRPINRSQTQAVFAAARAKIGYITSCRIRQVSHEM